MKSRRKKINKSKLIRSTFDTLLNDFPNSGYSRRELWAMRQEALAEMSPQERINMDWERLESASFREKYKAAIEENQKLQATIEEAFKLRKPLDTFTIKPKKSDGTSEAVAFMIASDFHIEEEVKPGQVNGLNKFNLSIAEQRTKEFFQNGLRLFQMTSRDVEIHTIVLALLGDFISGSIHDELMESNQLLPGDAIWKAQNMIASGINFLLKNTDAELIIPCTPGNHSRMTKKQRHGTEQGNSLETYMYRNLALLYEGEPRVKFIISEGYHIYLDIFRYTVRIHHGHAVNYGGGIGGISISMNKAIGQWDKSRRADYSICGHFHQFMDGGNFVCNGSLIGYNAFAVSIKAAFEKPKQTFFLLDKDRGKTIVCPITFSL